MCVYVSRGIRAVTEVAARPSNLQPNSGFGDSGVGPMDPKTVRAKLGLAVADRNVLKTARNRTKSGGRANHPEPPWGIPEGAMRGAAGPRRSC